MRVFSKSAHRYPSKKKPAGFTLIELIISMSLMVIISGILASIIASNFKMLGEVSDRKKMITRGMHAVNLFQREVGMITDSTNITIADDQQFKFNDKYLNTWEYVVTASNFTRQEVGIGSAMILATPVINSSTKFQYFDGDNAELTNIPLGANDLKLVRLIKLKLTMDDGFDGVSLLSIVYPENLNIYNKPLER